VVVARAVAVRRAGASGALIEVRRYLDAGANGRPRYRAELADQIDPILQAIREAGGVVSDVAVPPDPEASTT
jgi:hypothetical protein